MSEIVLDLDEHEMSLLESLAIENDMTVNQMAVRIFKNQINQDLAEITPTTALMNQLKGM